MLTRAGYGVTLLTLEDICEKKAWPHGPGWHSYDVRCFTLSARAVSKETHAMGSGQSAHTSTAILFILATALLYVSWRQNRLREEVMSLQQLVEASVSLHELQEHVLPAIDNLEKEASRLKREMQSLGRQAAATQSHKSAPATARAAKVLVPDSSMEEENYADGRNGKDAMDNEVDIEASDDAEDDAWDHHPQEHNQDRTGMGLPPDLTALMGSLIAGGAGSIYKQSGALGVPMARVVISSHRADLPGRATSLPMRTAAVEECFSETSDAGDEAHLSEQG